MSKKLLVAIIVGVVGIGGATGLIIFGSRFTSTTPTSEEQKNADSRQINANIAANSNAQDTQIFEDSSGISFTHYTNMTVTDITPNDNAYYTKLSLEGNNTKLSISALDTKFKTVDDWLKSDSKFATAALTGAVNLGGVSAKQYATSDSQIVVALDSGILYLIEAPQSSQSEKSLNLLVQSFTFGKSTPKTDTSSGEDIVYEAEETVE